MLPPITFRLGNGALPVQPGPPSDRLTLDAMTLHIQDNTSLFSDRGSYFRRWGELCWLENPRQSSLDTRLRFIVELAEKLENMNLSPDQPLTFISLGSGGLLFESYLHRYLTGRGYSRIQWRLIDIFYPNTYQEILLEEFRQKTDTRDAMLFASEQEYLNALSGGHGLADNDRSQGTTVVLVVNSPQMMTCNPLRGAHKDCLRFRATRVFDVSLANSVFLLICQKSQRQWLDESLAKISMNDKVTVLNNALRYSLTQDNQPRIRYCPSELGRLLHSRLEPYSRHLTAITAKLKQKMSLVNIDKIGDGLINEINNEEDFHMLKYYASDFDVGLDNLRGFFAAGASTMLATLDWNKASFT